MTKQDEIVTEVVARALFDHEWSAQPGLVSEWQGSRDYWIKGAQAAITAMHEASTPNPEAAKLIDELSSELAGLLPFLEAHHHSTKRLQELLTLTRGVDGL